MSGSMTGATDGPVTYTSPMILFDTQEELSDEEPEEEQEEEPEEEEPDEEEAEDEDEDEEAEMEAAVAELQAKREEAAERNKVCKTPRPCVRQPDAERADCLLQLTGTSGLHRVDRGGTCRGGR